MERRELRPITADFSGPAADTCDVAHADAALAGLSATVARLPRGDALCTAALRREAVAAVATGTNVRLADLLLFEAASPTHPAHEMCRNVEAELAACQRYLGALTYGYQTVASASAVTADVLLEILGLLVDVPCSQQRELIAATVADVDSWLCTTGSDVSTIAQAALVQDRLVRLATVVAECALLGRIAALLILRNDSPLPPPLILSRYIVSPCPEASADPQVVRWFAADVAERSREAHIMIARAAARTSDDEQRIAALGKAVHSAQRVSHAMQRAPVIGLPRLVDDTGLHVQAATSALHRLRALGIVREITGRYRHRVYSYDAYITALEGSR